MFVSILLHFHVFPNMFMYHYAFPNICKYLTAFHAVNPKIASIGEGNLVARTNGEVVLSISLELVCGIYFGYLAGVMASILRSKRIIASARMRWLSACSRRRIMCSSVSNGLKQTFRRLTCM